MRMQVGMCDKSKVNGCCMRVVVASKGRRPVKSCHMVRASTVCAYEEPLVILLAQGGADSILMPLVILKAKERRLLISASHQHL